MKRIKLKATEKPEKGFNAIATNDDIQVSVGKGDTDYVCGNCSNIVVKNAVEGQISKIGVICPKCGWKSNFD